MSSKWFYIGLSLIVIMAQGCRNNTAVPSDCSEFDLTPEECANLGTHSYSFVETAYEPCDQTDTGTTTFTITFVNNGVVINSPQNDSTTPNMRTSPNNYEGTFKTETGTEYAISQIFTLEGFTSTYTVVSGNGCSTSSKYTLMK